METEPFLVVSNLERHFGTVKAVDGVSFRLNRGEAVGLIGANGAGKTTLMRLLTTQEVPGAGRIELDGVDLFTHPELSVRIGWMPDDFVSPPCTTTEEYVDFFARAYRLKGEHRNREVDRVLAFCGLIPLRNHMVDKLSKGEKQRLGLARMLIGNPELLIMDEPAAGLDPKARAEFKRYVRTLQKEGKTLLISSHILSELSEMCDRLIMMDSGVIMEQGTQRELLATTEKEGLLVCIGVLGAPDGLIAELQQRPQWEAPQIELPDPHDSGGENAVPIAQLTARLLPKGEAEPWQTLASELRELSARFPIVSFTRRQRNLEETFVTLLDQRHA